MMSRFKLKTIHLEGNGLEKVLGELEAQIMEFVWMKDKSTVRDICDEFNCRSKDRSFNAIMTVMNRLVDKGILKKHSEGKVYAYRPVISKKNFSRMIAKDIISSVVQDPALFSVASFSDLALDLDAKTKKRLKKFLEKKL